MTIQLGGSRQEGAWGEDWMILGYAQTKTLLTVISVMPDQTV